MGSAYPSDGEVLPSSGGYQTLLDSITMACEARVLDAIRQNTDAIAGEGNCSVLQNSTCLIEMIDGSIVGEIR